VDGFKSTEYTPVELEALNRQTKMQMQAPTETESAKSNIKRQFNLGLIMTVLGSIVSYLIYETTLPKNFIFYFWSYCHWNFIYGHR
jgi:maltose/moltooligosaccharide transporter